MDTTTDKIKVMEYNILSNSFQILPQITICINEPMDFEIEDQMETKSFTGVTLGWFNIQILMGSYGV